MTVKIRSQIFAQKAVQIWVISGFYLLAMIWLLLSATGTYGTHEIQPWLAPAATGVTVVYGILMLLLWRHEERRATT
jgi:hypothetical protein